LITRGDLDGLVGAVVLSHFEKLEDILLVHPQDVADDRIVIKSDDVLVNLPFHPACKMWFDHHQLNQGRPRPPASFPGRHASEAPSAAQLVWEHYGKDPRFADMVREASRLDSADLEEKDVLEPDGYILLGYTLDGRTGLGPYEHYFRKCYEALRDGAIEELLAHPMVQFRVRQMREDEARFREALESCSTVHGNVVLTDFRGYLFPPVGNRFLVYCVFPQVNVAFRVHWGPRRAYVVAAVGHSIFDRSCSTNAAELLSRYGGGGHARAASSPLPVDRTDEAIAEILEELKANG
jgi:hypothetical protein